MAEINQTSGPEISLIGQNGKVVTGPVETAPELLKSGAFRFLTDEEATMLGMRDYANTIPEQLKNIGSNYLSTASFGATDLLKRQVSTPEELEYERIRREENPGGSILGTGVGVLMDPLAIGGAAVKGLGKAAQIAGSEKLAANLIRGSEAISGASKFMPTRVVENGAEALSKAVNPLADDIASRLISAETSPITQQVLAKIPGRAIRGSTIGGAFAAGQSISEQSLGDVDLSGEKIFADGMNGALMGLVFDTSLGALADTVVGGTKKLYGALKNNESLQNSYSKIISRFASADETVVKATIQAEREAQAIINSAEKDPNAIQNLSSNLKQIFGDSSEYTQSQLGNKVKEGFAASYKFLNDLYGREFAPLRAKYSEAPISYKFGMDLFDNIEKQLTKNSPAQRILRQYEGNFTSLKDANDLFKLRSSLVGEMVGESIAKVNGALRNDAGLVGTMLREAEDQALIMAAKRTGLPEEIKLAQKASDSLAAERALYSKDMTKLKALTQSLGLKRVKSMRDLIERLGETDGNILIEKMFKNRANVKSLEFLRDNFEDQFKNLTDAFKNKIAIQATKNGKFNPVKALELVSDRNIPPEVRRMIFGEAGEEALKASAKAFAGETAENFARNEARRELLLQNEVDNTYTQTGAILGSIGGIPGAGVGAAIGQTLDVITNKNRAARAFLGFEKAFKAFDEKIGRVASEIFEKNPIKASELAKIGVSSKITAERSDRDSLRKNENKDPRTLNHEQMINNLSEWSENPDKLVEHVSNEFGEMDQFAPGIAQAAQATAYRAIDLLKEKLPVMPPRRPLDFSPYVVPTSEAFKFGRFYNTVMNPMGTLREVQNGTLTNDNIEVMMRVYPQLYKNMQEILMMEMIKYNDKKEKEPMPSWKKLSLSLFLNNNLSDSLEQKNMGANYSNWLSNEMLSGQDGSGAPQVASKGNQAGKNISKSYMTQTQKAQNEIV